MAFFKWLYSWTDLNFQKIPIFGRLLKWLQDHNMDFGIHITAICFFILYLIYAASDVLLGSSMSFFFTLAPIWFPLIAIDIFHFRWVDYVTKKFYLRNGRTQYRVMLPQEVLKSPEAMEFVLTQMWTTQNPDNYWQTYIDGKNPLPVTLEIVSIGGDVRFYINVNSKKTKEGFVPAIYSQYPGVELVEEPVDYAAEIAVGDPDWDVWVTHLGKKMKKWAPIKTYIDFKLDSLPKEEEKVDPITTIIEMLGSIGPDERVYVQFNLKPFRKSSFINGQLMWPWEEGPDWTKDADAHIDEIMQRDPVTKAPVSAEGSDFDGMPRITPGERDTVEAIERNREKYAFKTAVRYVYLAKKGKFRSTMINPLNRIFAQFDLIGREQIGVRWRTDFDYMWFSDPFGDRLELTRKVEHKHYKLRKYANQNQKDHPKIFTTEEIATLFHIPGQVALTPTLGRIPSTRSQAPANLPVGDLPTQS